MALTNDGDIMSGYSLNFQHEFNNPQLSDRILVVTETPEKAVSCEKLITSTWETGTPLSSLDAGEFLGLSWPSIFWPNFYVSWYIFPIFRIKFYSCQLDLLDVVWLVQLCSIFSK